MRILVGRWGPLALADESTQVLRDTGANLVASTLLETRTYLAGLVGIPRIPFRRQTSRTLRSSSGVAGLKIWSTDTGVLNCTVHSSAFARMLLWVMMQSSDESLHSSGWRIARCHEPTESQGFGSTTRRR